LRIHNHVEDQFAVRIVVIIATTGRPELLCLVIDWLFRQTRQPDSIVVSAVGPEDTKGLVLNQGRPIELIFAERGLPRQRNAALRHVGENADIIVFFDDDFVPATDYLEALEKAFIERPSLVGATGRLLADGIKTPGISFEDAVAMANGHEAPRIIQERALPALYGCNLCIRAEAARSIWFDERLPLYGWQEDVDFSYQLGAQGVLVYTNLLTGVHLGAKGGRTSGKRLGYSQIANPVYLLRKRTMPRKLAWRLMTRNLAANVLRSVWPEPYIDRRGRLLGNAAALYDLLRGRIHPERILSL
jgi:GT2 family glycosyltransferase